MPSPDRKPHGPIHLPAWQTGERFSTDSLNTALGVQAVRIATEIYSAGDEIIPGRRWELKRRSSNERGVDAIEVFPSIGLLILHGNKLKPETVLQGTRTQPQKIMAYGIEAIQAESADGHGTVTFTTRTTLRPGERVRVHSTGALTKLKPKTRKGAPPPNKGHDYYTGPTDDHPVNAGGEITP